MLNVEKKTVEGSIVGIASKNVDFEKKKWINKCSTYLEEWATV